MSFYYLPLIPWIGQVGSILLVKVLYDLCYGLHHFRFNGLTGGVSTDHLPLATSWILNCPSLSLSVLVAVCLSHYPLQSFSLSFFCLAPSLVIVLSLFANPSLSLFLYLSTFISIYLPLYLSIYIPTYLSMYLTNYLSCWMILYF